MDSRQGIGDDKQATGDEGQGPLVSCPATTQVLLIGYGNPLRGDDGTGWHAAEYLAQTMQAASVQVMCCHQLTPELAEAISKVGLVIFIDAAIVNPAQPDQTAGHIYCQEVTDLPRSNPSSSHHLTPAILLECTRLLYATSPVAFLLTMTGDSFEYEAQLSPAVRAGLPELYNHVYTLISQYAPNFKDMIR